ncbi:MAG: fatty acid--CoA ligase family protein [Actinobacteria bacterium]|nr:fatty acid--CoA ligase family protein [Actinomycetota bacterium]
MTPNAEPDDWPEGLPRTVPAVVERAAVRFGAREGLVEGEMRLSFAEVADRVDEAARALVGSGIEPGDRIAIWAPNVSEWIFVALGAHRAGAVVVPLNTRFKGEEAAYILRTAGARMLFTVTDFLDTDYVALLRGASEAPELEEIVVLRGATPAGTTAWADFVARATGIEPSATAARAAPLRPDDLCDILFTSGTTGAPKGAMLTHGATVRAYDAWSQVVGLREGDRYLIVNPFFHAFGLKAGIVASLLTGATIVPHLVFDVPSVMQRVVEERITMLPGPPAIYQTILDHPDLASFDLSSLRLAVTGAATVPVEMIRRMGSELAFETIVTGYGLTEATGIATMCRHDDDPETIANTAGCAIPGVEVRVVDDAGADVPTGQPGEVVIRGYNLMQGFFENPAATAEAIDRAGWLHTGDVGVLDARGYLKITDRKKDMYIVGGFNAYPAEIENLMMGHPAIGQVAVVAVPDHRLGEVGVAFVVPRAGATVEPDAVIAWCREQMANYKVPRRVEVVDSLPLNASGKVLKFVLREQAETS